MQVTYILYHIACVELHSSFVPERSIQVAYRMIGAHLGIKLKKPSSNTASSKFTSSDDITESTEMEDAGHN